jgi:hypothetical protein
LQIAAALQRICWSSEMIPCVQIALLHNSLFRQFLLLGIQIALLHNSLFRQFCSCEFRLHFFTIHSSDNFVLGNSDYSSSQFIIQRTLLLWIQIALLHNSFFRQFCSWEFRLLFFTIHSSENFALVNSDCSSSQFFLHTILLSFRIALHCSWEFVLQFLISNHQCLNPFTDIHWPCLGRQGYCV